MPQDPVPESNRVVKRRRHGYRGYGSPLRHDHAGSIHWGQGFGGVGVAREVGLLPPHSDLVPEELRERFPAGRK